MTAASQNGRYEVIIVGSGSAGSVISRRLVDAGLNVLLLEAGGLDTNPAIHDPSRSHDLWHAEEDWNYNTAAQLNCGDRPIHWPRGKVLGGSSSLNGMIYLRGSRLDYDLWAYLGNAGWGYDDILPLFRRSEDSDRGESPYHGVGGPMTVTTKFQADEIHQAIVSAAQEAGLAFNPDPNGEQLDGVGYMQYTIRDGQRLSVSKAFLTEVVDSPRLTLSCDSLAHRLLFDGERCKGVEYVHEGQLKTAHADLEVVVSAGTIESPKLLMVSGVGPADRLKAVGVAAWLDLPGVGENLHDHAVCPVIFSSPRDIPRPAPGLTEMQSQAFWRSRPGLLGPDVQPLHFSTPRYQPWMEGPPQGYTLMAGIIRPASRGSIELSGPEIEDPLLIDPRYLCCEADQLAMEAGLELCREVGVQPALSPWFGAELYPGPEVRDRASMRQYIGRSLGSYHHQVGTCKMGVDELAVVDPELRVRGIQGLRVADASVMPAVTSGNTNAPTVMIGEKASDMIIDAHAT